jgi:hypothetical protein
VNETGLAMSPSESNPYRPPASVQSAAASNAPRLNWAGRVLLCLAFLVALAFFAYCGAVLGSLIGIERGMPHLNSPPKGGVGLAPDLSGLVKAAVEYGVTMIVSLLTSLVTGAVIAWLGCYFFLAPLLRKMRAFTNR